AALYRRIRAAGRVPVPRREVAAAGPPNRRLPCPLTRLIGREDQIDEVAACLRGARLVTLTGSGGVGKTRLATAVAGRVAGEHADAGTDTIAQRAPGCWFVDLAPLSD